MQFWELERMSSISKTDENNFNNKICFNMRTVSLTVLS